MRAIKLQIILSVLFLVSTVTALPEEVEANIEENMLILLEGQDSVASASINLDRNNAFQATVEPEMGSFMSETAANMTLSLVILTGQFVALHDEIPEIESMNVTFVNPKNETIGKAYCLGEWVDEVRVEGDNINMDDLGRLVWRTIDTLRIYPRPGY